MGSAATLNSDNSKYLSGEKMGGGGGPMQKQIVFITPLVYP